MREGSHNQDRVRRPVRAEERRARRECRARVGAVDEEGGELHYIDGAASGDLQHAGDDRARHRLVDSSEMGGLFKVLAVSSAESPPPAGFAPSKVVS